MCSRINNFQHLHDVDTRATIHSHCGATVGYVKVIDLDYADGVAISAVFGTLVAALDAFNNWVWKNRRLARQVHSQKIRNIGCVVCICWRVFWMWWRQLICKVWVSVGNVIFSLVLIRHTLIVARVYWWCWVKLRLHGCAEKGSQWIDKAGRPDWRWLLCGGQNHIVCDLVSDQHEVVGQGWYG